jgi:zinc-ribbon domain
MQICRNCQHENADNARFCTNCSFSLEWETERPAPKPKSEETVIVEPAPDVGKAGVYVGLSATSLSVVAGGATACDVQVRNVGAVADSYRLDVTGPAPGVGQLWPSQVALEPGEQATAQLSFAAPYEAHSGAQVLDFDVRAVSEREARVVATAHGALEVVPPPSSTAAEPGSMHIPTVLQLLVAAAVLVIVQASFVDDRFFGNDFGGVSHFRSQAAMYIAKFVTGLPVVVFGATAAVGIALLGRPRRYKQVIGSGLLVAAGAQASVLFVVTALKWHDARFTFALLAALVVLAVGAWALSALSRGLEWSKLSDLEAWERRTVYGGVATSAVGMVIPFNTVTVGASETKLGATAVEGAAIFAGLALVLLCTRIALPRLGFGAVLLAVGIGTASIWIRFAGVSRLETTAVADPGYGAVIGLCGAIALIVAAAAILSEPETVQAPAPAVSSHV